MNTLEERRSLLTNAGSQEVVFLKKKDIENVKTKKQNPVGGKSFSVG